MRIVLAGVLALAGVGGFAAMGHAQSSLGGADNANTIAIPPPPPMVASPPSPAVPPAPPMPQPPGLVQTPLPPANTDTGGNASNGVSGGGTAPPVGNQTTAPAARGPAANVPSPATSMPMTDNWVPGKTAEIGILDRVDGGIANLQIPVGGQTISGDLQISVLACVMRPADEISDAAIFVNVQSTADNAGAPIFHGWMVRSIPAAAVVGDSSETLRVANCT